MIGTKLTGTVFLALIVIVLLSSITSAATDIDYKKGTQVKYQPEVSEGVKEIQFMAECDGVMTVSGSGADNRVDILSSCKPRNLYIQFVVPNDRAVYLYQTKDLAGKKIAVRVLQKRIAVSTDGRYNIILTKPESTGRFEFMGDSVNQDDNFIIEDAADQMIKANIKTIDIKTINAESVMRKDKELYNSLQATNLSVVDHMFFKRVKNTMEVLGVGGISNEIGKFFDGIRSRLNNIIGGN